MKDYEKTGSTGTPGRATARGLERLSFYPVIGLLALVVLVVGGYHFYKNWDPRTEADFDQQYEVLVSTLRDNFQATADGLPRLPERSDWQVRSFGDIDEWRTDLLVGNGENPTTMEVVIEFNQKVRGLQPQIVEPSD